MKKLNLLSRAEMKKVMGGYGQDEEIGGTCGTSDCTCDTDCKTPSNPKCKSMTCQSDGSTLYHCGVA